MAPTALNESSPIPRLRDGIDITRAGLSLDEGFLVSRVDGRTPVHQLALLVAKTREETQKVVDRLVKAGILLVGEEPETVSSNDSDDPYAGFRFDPDAMAEPVDLSEEERKRILFTHAGLDEVSFYQLLGVRWRDDAKAVKKAYFSRSKEWHPDRFRRPNLGSFAGRIDDIFRAIRDAYAVLSDPKRKADYDRIYAPMFDEEDMAAILAEDRRGDRESRREEERRRRRLERNPMRKRMMRAKELYEEALVLEGNGELLEALRIAQAACAYHEQREYQELKERLQTATAELRIAPLMRRGLNAENMTSWTDAVTIFSEAVRLAPKDGPARLRLAYNMLMAGRPAAEVSEHVQKALLACPDDPEAHFVRGLCYERGGMDKAAIRAYQRALELKPNYAEAKKRLKKLRWGF